MPTQYTDDVLGNSIEQSWLGQNGIYTGQSAANAHAYMDHVGARRSAGGAGAAVQPGRHSAVLGLSRLAAIGFGIYLGVQSSSWLTGVAVALGLLALVSVGAWFLETRVGRALREAVKVLMALAVVALMIYGVYLEWGVGGIAWGAGVIGGVCGLVAAATALQRGMRWFLRETGFGRAVVRAVALATRTLLVVGVTAAAIYVVAALAN